MNYHPLLKNALIIFIGLTLSNCTDEELFYEDKSPPLFENRIENTENQKPFNYSNPYESMGVLHNEVLSQYMELEIPPQELETIALRVQLLMNQHQGAFGIFQASWIDLSAIEAILENPETSLEDILSNSNLSSGAKNSLYDFIDTLLLMSDEEFSEIFAFITAYESDVINHVNLTAMEKEVILTVTSIVRHSIYFEKGRDDGDWVTSVGNIVAAIKGALAGDLSAVQYALITGLAIVMQE